MSGVEERPVSMPVCKCFGRRAWLVRGEPAGLDSPILTVNLTERAARKYGKWNKFGYTKEYVLSCAVCMSCSSCGKMAPYSDLLKLLKLFKKECLDD